MGFEEGEEFYRSCALARMKHQKRPVKGTGLEGNSIGYAISSSTTNRRSACLLSSEPKGCVLECRTSPLGRSIRMGKHPLGQGVDPIVQIHIQSLRKGPGHGGRT